MEPIIASIITGLIISVIGGVIIAYLKRKWSKKDKIEMKQTKQENEQYEAIQKMERSIWRLNKTVLIMAKIIDDQTARNHPELTSSLEDIASELLKESDKS